MRITSAANPRVKAACRLRERRHREREGRFLIEGRRELTRALSAGVEVESVFYCPALCDEVEAFDLTQGIEVSPAVFERLAMRREGVVAVARQPSHRLVHLPRPPVPVYLVVDGLEKPGNLGAVIRSADAAGVDGVIVCGEGTDLYNPNVVRASLGTLFTVPVVESNAEEAIAWLRKSPIVVATPEAETLYTAVPLQGALVVGSEDQGVGPAWRKVATETVRIPMRGAADSLNVAMAATLLAFAATAERPEKKV